MQEVRNSTRFLLRSFKAKADQLKLTAGEDVRELLRFGVDQASARSTALSFFGGFFGLQSIAWQAHVVAMIFGFVAAPLVMRIPVGRQRPLKPMSFTQWQALATTLELRSILEEAERADIPEIRDAWLEKFVHAMRCPQCGGPVKMRFGRLTSPCGWRGRLG